MKSILFVITLITFLGVSRTLAATDIDIQSQMTSEELRASGLEKLTDSELKYLNNWLKSKQTTQIPEIKPNTATTPAEQTTVTPKNVQRQLSRKEAEEILNAPIKTRIKGKFTGWTGKTVFHLENGETWRQRKNGFYRKKLESPEVILKKNYFGFYEMTIVETGRKVGIKKVD